jgi:dienelactone hydrolase
MTTRAEHHAENVRRAQNVNAAAAAFGGSQSARKTETVSGRNSLDVGGASAAPVQVVARKADRAVMHPRTQAAAAELSDNAARLLDLVVRKDEEFGGSRLVDVVVQKIASALDLPEEEAEAARRDLEARGLIAFFDNFSGDRGFRVRA